MLLSVLSKLGNTSKKAGQLDDWPKYVEQLEQMVDDVNRAAIELQKGLQQNGFVRKQAKKCADAQMAAVFKKVSEKRYGDRKLFPNVLEVSANVMQELSSYRQEFENQVEKMVFLPLNYLSSSTCTEIGRCRRGLSKATADMRAAREQFYKAQAQATAINGGNFTAEEISTNAMLVSSSAQQSNYDNLSTTRIHNLQEQLNIKENDLLECRENLLRGLYSFALMEESYIQYVIDFHRQQEVYFEKCLQSLKSAFLHLNIIVLKTKPLVCFGQSLSTHLSETGRSIAYPLEVCIRSLNNEEDLNYEGLFRKSGSLKRVDLLVKALNLMQVDELLIDTCDPSVVSAAVKQYLGSLPEPLVTFKFATKWSEGVSSLSSTSSVSVDSAQNLIVGPLREIPIENFRNLAYLCRFLAKVASRSATNKMTPRNLSIVVAPNIYWLPTEEAATASSRNEASALLHSSGLAIQLLELLIQKVDVFFPKESAGSKQQPTISKRPDVTKSRASMFEPLKMESSDSSSAGCTSRSSFVVTNNPPVPSKSYSDEALERSCKDSETTTVQIPTAFKVCDNPIKPNFAVPRKKNLAPWPPFQPGDTSKEYAESSLALPPKLSMLHPDVPPSLKPADSTSGRHTPPVPPTRARVTFSPTTNLSPDSQIPDRPC